MIELGLFGLHWASVGLFCMYYLLTGLLIGFPIFAIASRIDKGDWTVDLVEIASSIVCWPLLLMVMLITPITLLIFGGDDETG